MTLTPAHPDPRISPLAAMQHAGMSFADLAKACRYSETRIRETIRAREKSLAACLSGDRRPVAKQNRTGERVTRLICHALKADTIFYSLPAGTGLVPAVEAEKASLFPGTNGAIRSGTGRPAKLGGGTAILAAHHNKNENRGGEKKPAAVKPPVHNSIEFSTDVYPPGG